MRIQVNNIPRFKMPSLAHLMAHVDTGVFLDTRVNNDCDGAPLFFFRILWSTCVNKGLMCTVIFSLLSISLANILSRNRKRWWIFVGMILVCSKSSLQDDLHYKCLRLRSQDCLSQFLLLKVSSTIKTRPVSSKLNAQCSMLEFVARQFEVESDYISLYTSDRPQEF